MSERTTADIVKDLRWYGPGYPSVLSEAADRLADITAALPNCPTCGGTGLVEEPIPPGVKRFAPIWTPCPDCRDTPGKVSIERCFATYRAVQEFLAYSEKARSDPDTLRHLLKL